MKIGQPIAFQGLKQLAVGEQQVKTSLAEDKKVMDGFLQSFSENKVNASIHEKAGFDYNGQRALAQSLPADDTIVFSYIDEDSQAVKLHVSKAEITQSKDLNKLKMAETFEFIKDTIKGKKEKANVSYAIPMLFWNFSLAIITVLSGMNNLNTSLENKERVVMMQENTPTEVVILNQENIDYEVAKGQSNVIGGIMTTAGLCSGAFLAAMARDKQNKNKELDTEAKTLIG